MDEMQRLRGTFYGQAIGDALGARYEFKKAGMVVEQMKRDRAVLFGFGEHKRVPILGEPKRWVEPGQVTDDTEMATCLARSLVANNGFNKEHIACSYVQWKLLCPPNIGCTTLSALAIGG